MIVQFKKWVKLYIIFLLLMTSIGFIYSIISYPFNNGVSILTLFTLILFALSYIHVISFKIQIDSMKIEVKSVLLRKKIVRIKDIVEVKNKHNAWRFISNKATVKITTDLENQQEAVSLILKILNSG